VALILGASKYGGLPSEAFGAGGFIEMFRTSTVMFFSIFSILIIILKKEDFGIVL
jgi:hypothetical protein